MKKFFNRKNKIYMRIVSITLILVLMLTGIPMDLIPVDLIREDIMERTGLVMKVKADNELNTLKAKYSGHSYTFTSDGPEISEYSQCFQDATWAADHANDTITLNPTSGRFLFDQNYNPIGNASAPFGGTIYLNTGADDYYIETFSPIFDYVKDSAKLYKLGTTTVIPLNIKRLADAYATSEYGEVSPSPLLANHMLGSSATTPYEWKVMLNSANAKSYSGVIYEMTSGAKIDLTFTDNSSHTPTLDNNDNIVSGSIIDNKESSKNYGILCGSINGGSVLKAKYTKANDDKVIFIGTETAYCGGLIGEIKGDSTFELLSGSSATKVDFKTPKNQVGFICGHAESSTITLPTGYTFDGTIDGTIGTNDYAGGIAGYCKNTTVNYSTATGIITLSDCEIKNGKTTGGVFGYYECDSLANDILINRTYTLTNCKVEGKGVNGGIAGEYKPAYPDAVTIDLNKYTLGNSITLNTGTSAGGLFGKYTAPGNVTITDSVTSNDHFVPPSSSVAYGGIIGEYVNGAYSKTLTLSDFTVNNLDASSSGNVGGIIRQLTGSTYVNVSGVSVTNASVSSATPFGGIISTLNGDNAGSFIDVTGNFTLSLASDTTYKGGAIAGSFKKGVIRFAGVTDISGAKAENGYAQLVYENDETLVYAKGSGSDYTPAGTDSETGEPIQESGWTLKRNSATTASDLGQWGEVVRLFKVGDDYKDVEGAGIVSVASDNTVTVAKGVTNITDTVSFAKCALNMQLNDGSNHGALCFETGGANKTTLLSSAITVVGEIDLSGTGLLGFMRDGGNGKSISSNAFSSSVDFFEGSISGTTGASTDKILLNVGEVYGCDASGNALDSTATGGRIYLSNTNNGHDSQGLFAFAKSASITNLMVGGKINVERNVNESSLYAGALFGAMTNGATLSGVTINTKIDATKSGDKGFYIGGVSGIFDGNIGTTAYALSVASNCSVKPEIKLNGSIGSTYAGGILGYLNGAAATKYNVSVASSNVSPKIEIGTGVADVDNSYIGGMIGRIENNTTNTRSVTLSSVTMTGASVLTKSKYSGGLLGSHWLRTNLTVNGLTITGSSVTSKYSNSGSKQSGLVFKGSGKWDINTLSIGSTSFSSTSGALASFGLIVNEAYNGNDGLYINLKDSGYTLRGVTVPTSSTDANYFVDEIAADTSSGDILAGGNGTGIVNINMNKVVNNVEETATRITDIDSSDAENGTGTYQNRLYSQLGNLIGNQNSRYYYNLDVMLAKGTKGSTASGGEKFLLWSVRKYAAGNIKGYFKDNDDMITETTVNLSGLSYYPISGGVVTLPEGATVTFGYNAIHNYENQTITPDNWKRFPDNIGVPKSDSARNQHYLMQTGLFTTTSSLTANTLTLTGDFGYVAGVASGALINGSTSGTVSLNGLTLDMLVPSNSASYLLINYIDGTAETARPILGVSNLRATNYNAAGVTLPVANSLFGKAQGQNMTMTFSNIKLDARNGEAIKDTKWTDGAATDMTTAYGTGRSIFNYAIFFTELLAAKTSTMEYFYTVEEDWGTGTPRNVTYGKEVTSSKEYENGEKRYNISSGTGHYTNPVSDSNIEFDFSAGFLPYVKNYENKGLDPTYPVVEIKVNYKVEGLVEGCGTYNDPYVISTSKQLKVVADAINNNTLPGNIKLPNEYNADNVITSWHNANGAGDGLYNLSGDNYVKDSSNSTYGLDDKWNKTNVRHYLASAYYVITADLTGTNNSLPSDFEGIGKPGAAVDGNIVFHGVIVGKKSDGTKPTINNPSPNPLIYISNGSVVKNLIINVTAASITKSLGRVGDEALYGYKQNDNTNKGAEYYGAVIGEIMGGDNIIDDVTVTYSGTTTLGGTYKHLIAEGGMVGAVVNGALIFRGSNSVSGRRVTGGGIYSNPFVGRVINGYAIYEKISGRTGTAPDNYNKITGEGENVTKTYAYPIDTIDRSNKNKLDINWSDSTITIPDAQSLYIMSLITQSIASTADSNSHQYGTYSPSYGYNDYVTGIARLGDYTDIGCGASVAEQPDDYSDYATFDSVNNYTNSSSIDGLMKAPIPYIVYRYTTRYGETTTNPAADFPARRMTFDNAKFWDITLSSKGDFSGFDSFQAFRGIGCAGINAYRIDNDASKTAMKVATFNGGGKTLKLHISLPRYERNQENYFHKQNKSLTQSYLGEDLHYNVQDTTKPSPYGHDDNLNKLMGLGLFDCVMVNNDSTHKYQFQNITLQGTIEDKVYNNSNADKTGKTDQTQLFCVGGVVGKRIFGNNSDLNFSSIIFDGLTITGAYSCGGLIGIDSIGKKGKPNDTAVDAAKKSMRIDGCNSTANGISITGGYYGYDNNIRHGIGSFVGMTFWCRPYIDGETDSSDTSNISVSNVTTSYEGDKGCSVGGLIGYTGSGAEIKNINLVAANSNAVIGGQKASNAAGFIGFTQAMTEDKTSKRDTPNQNDLKDCVYIENCTVQNLPIKAKNGAGGFVAKTGNTHTWHTKYIYISDCAVIGNANNKPEIKAYGTGSIIQTNCVGGFVGDLRSSVVTCLIQNSYIENYTIEGWHVGGIIGETTYRPVNLRNLYVKNCEIIRNNTGSGAMGGIVGYSDQNINGYNLKIDGANFKIKTSESPSDAGFILGANDNNTRIDKFVGIGAYHTTTSVVPTSVVKTNGTSVNNLFVWADYKNTSASDTNSHASMFNVVDTATSGQKATVEQPVAPFLTVNPRAGMGRSEYITGDGASVGKAGEIYKDYKDNSSNRRYGVGTSDATTLANYINTNGTYTNGAFKISKASTEFGTLPTGVQDFAMLVINDDGDKKSDITPFIKSYIRLVTNAENSSNQYKNNQYAYSYGNNDIDKLYKVVVRPCYYDSGEGNFVLGNADDSGLKIKSDGTYEFVSENADSEAGNYQFSLIDVQYIDPTDSTKIAYHLYVPVYTKKILTAEFSAVTMSATTYNRSPYANKIASEIAAHKTRSILVESTNEWTTTFIRYTYPKNQITSGDNWNFDKSIKLKLDAQNFSTLPSGTELILVDPNANSDKYYKLTLDSSYTNIADITLNLTSFKDESNTPFSPKNLSDILADQEASGTAEGHTNELYEDYYISIYVPNLSDGQTHGIEINSDSLMTYTSGGNTQKANIDIKLYSYVVLGDLFTHSITQNSFIVTSGDGESLWDDNREMTNVNKVLKTEVTATVQIKNLTAGSFLSNSDVYHAFYLTLTSHDASGKVSDIIYGITPGNVHNTTTISYTDSVSHTEEVTHSYLGANYVYLKSGSIRDALMDPSLMPIVTIHSVTTMTFNDITAFPFNPSGDSNKNIGTQVSVKSSVAYREDDLRFSALNSVADDPDGNRYYSTTQNTAQLSFNAVPTDDISDEIGYKTNNRSLLGVNGKYGIQHPIVGKAIYNVDDIIDYNSADKVVYTITLYKKVTDGNGTRYVQVSDISNYLSNVNLTDSNSEVTLEANRSNHREYVYTGAINHESQLDLDKMFEVDFSCTVLTGDSTHNEYANYKVVLTADLEGATNAWKDSYLVYTNAKFDPSVIDEN